MGTIIDAYLEFLLHNEAWFISAAILLALATSIYFLLSVLRLRKLRRLYQSVLASDEPGVLEKRMLAQIEAQEALARRVAALEEKAARLQQEAGRHLQVLKLARYRAFKDMGSDQSFTAIFLDGLKDGVVLTGIHGREESRVYAKSLAGGQAGYPLSEEEEKLLKEALQEFDHRQQDIRQSTAKK